MTFALLEASIWVWLIIFSPILLILGALAVNNKAGSSIVFILVVLAIFQFFTDATPLRLVTEHSRAFFGGVAAYVAVGLLYMTVRWKWFFLPKVKAAYDEFMADPQNAAKPLNDRNREFHYYASHLGVRGFPIKVSDYKSVLYCWTFYWFVVIIGDVLDDPLRLFREWIGRKLQKMADAEFNGV